MADGREGRPPGLTRQEWSPRWGLRFRVRERLSRSLIVVPSLYIIGAFLLAEVVPRLEGDADTLGMALNGDTARTMLSAIAGGMIAFTGLVVSIAILVVQFGASQYTPRLVNLFRRDPRVKHSLGIFIAPAVFALVSLRAIGEGSATTVPSFTVVLAMLLLVAAVLAFLVLVAGLLDLLRPRRVVARIVTQAADAIAQTYPGAMDPAGGLSGDPAGPVRATVAHAGHPGVLSALDRGRLVRVARAAGAVIEVGAPVGAYIHAGAPLFRIRGEADGVDRDELGRSVILAEERTIAQDPAFAIRMIVDIGLRALSPAVNDPTTAVQALDGLGSLLGALAARDLQGRGRLADTQGRLRLVYPTADWPDLLDLSFTEIRHYGVTSPQIPRRLRALVLGLVDVTDPARHDALHEQLARLDASVRRAYGDPAELAHAMEPDILGIGTRLGAIG